MCTQVVRLIERGFSLLHLYVIFIGAHVSCKVELLCIANILYPLLFAILIGSCDNHIMSDAEVPDELYTWSNLSFNCFEYLNIQFSWKFAY